MKPSKPCAWCGKKVFRGKGNFCSAECLLAAIQTVLQMKIDWEPPRRNSVKQWR